MGKLRIQAVIFDAVGTLLRPREAVGESYSRIAAEHGVSLPASRLDEAFRRVFAAAEPNVHPGEPLDRAAELERDWWRSLVRQSFRAADQMARFSDFEAFFDALWLHYADPRSWELLPGVPRALDALHAERRQLALLSNFDQRLRSLLRDLGLHDRFDAVTLPADAGAAKPERAIFDVCLKRLGLPAARAVYVGDHATLDVKAARAAGLHAIDAGTLPDLDALPGAIAALEESA